MKVQCMKQGTQSPKSVLWDNQEGWDGEGDGRGFQVGGIHVHPRVIHVDVGQKKKAQYYKETIFQL